jgi:heavy metal sensor kinase
MMKIPAKFRSVRVLLTAWYSALLLTGSMIFAGATYFYLQTLLVGTLDDDLTMELESIVAIVDRYESVADTVNISQFFRSDPVILDDYIRMNLRNYIVLLSLIDGTLLYESNNWAGLSTPDADGKPDRMVFVTKKSPKGNIRVCLAYEYPFVIQIAYPEKYVDRALSHLLRVIIILIPVVFIFSVSGGWLIATLALRPFDRITEMANRITVSNLEDRIPDRGVLDEIGRLVTTINDMIGRLQHSFKQIREFSLNIAHELRTPLTILKGEAELAATKQMTPDEARQLANVFLEETVRISYIVDDLLTLAKADAGQMKIDQNDVEFSLLVDELYENAQLLAYKKDLTIRLDQNDHAAITGDPSRLRQLLRNLIMNAIQYTPPGGTIRITSKRETNILVVRVQDSGIGIDPEELPNIFKAFYRTESARIRARSGSGLGLAISRWITHAHGGTITVTSTPGQGSTFIVTLPIVQISR